MYFLVGVSAKTDLHISIHYAYIHKYMIYAYIKNATCVLTYIFAYVCVCVYTYTHIEGRGMLT